MMLLVVDWIFFLLLVEMDFNCSKGGWEIFFNILCCETGECDKKIVIDGAEKR